MNLSFYKVKNHHLLQLKLLIISFLILFLCNIIFQTIGIFFIYPYISLMIAVYFNINCPSSSTSLIIFLIGIFSDIIYSNIIGVSSFALLLIYYLTKKRTFIHNNPSLYIIWLWFIVAAIIFCIVKYIIFSIINQEIFLGFKNVLLQFILSIVTFPIFYMLFDKIYSNILKQHA
jgi:rod shape-determining protein MreD